MMGRAFENDVKIYGIKTNHNRKRLSYTFENDVKIYGIKTDYTALQEQACLRMM